MSSRVVAAFASSIVAAGCAADTGVATIRQAATVCETANVNGMDVSSYDTVTDWSAAKAAGIDFAFIRASDGTQYPDPSFAGYWSGAKAAGYSVTLAQYEAFWHAFWAKSFVQYSNAGGDADYLENAYYLATYMIAAGAYGTTPFTSSTGCSAPRRTIQSGATRTGTGISATSTIRFSPPTTPTS